MAAVSNVSRMAASVSVSARARQVGADALGQRLHEHR